MILANRPKVRLFVLLLVLSALIYVAGTSSSFVEHYYSDGSYQFSAVVQRWLSSPFPFALGDFLYVFLILYVLWTSYRLLKKRKTITKASRRDLPFQVASFMLILYLAFKLLWGLNYSRPSISSRLGIAAEKYNTEQLLSLARFFITRINQSQHIEKPRYDIHTLKQKAKESYDLMQRRQDFFKYTCPSVKPVLNSWLITKIGIEGYYNPLSGEANVNMMLPRTALPFVTCHEIAHQLGIAREDEANLIGYLSAVNSADAFFRYSANYNMLRSILLEIRRRAPEHYQEIYETINKGTIAEFKNDRAFWQKYNSDMYGYMDAALDSFLKLNNQHKGTDSYQDIVIWLYNIHKKELDLERTGKTLQP